MGGGGGREREIIETHYPGRGKREREISHNATGNHQRWE